MEVLFLELPQVGRRLTAGESFGGVESVKAFPQALRYSSEPYGDGWMIVVEASNPDDWQALLSADDYQATIS